MRYVPPVLQTHLEGDTTTLSLCWRIERRDSIELFFTDHDCNIVVDGDAYVASKGLGPTGSEQSRDLSAGNFEIVTSLSEGGITEIDIRKGLFDLATVDAFLVNWKDPSEGKIYLARGWTVGQIEIRDLVASLEILSKSKRLDQDANQAYSPSCRATLGDARCGVDLEGSFPGTYRYDGEVEVVSESGRAFIDSATIDSGQMEVFTNGKLVWIYGDNAGVEVEVKKWSPDTGRFDLFDAMIYPIAVGDVFVVYWGCDKTAQTCRDRFDNILNFRGEPYIPGMDAILRFQSHETT